MNNTIKLFGTAITAIAVTFSATVTSAHNAPLKEKLPGIYIGKLEVQPSVVSAAKSVGKELVLRRLAQSLDTQLISALSSVGVFQLVERKRKSDIELEQGFAATAVDVNDKDAAKLGEMAGAKYVFLPQIDGFEDLVDTQKYNAIERVSMRRKLYLSATATIVDTTTGKLLPNVVTAQMSMEQVVRNSRSKNFLQGSDSAIVELAARVADKLCQSAAAVLRPPKILAVTGKQVLINRGISAGFIKGVKVNFFAYNNVKDDDSGKVFINEVPVGEGVVIRAESGQSYAEIQGENLGISKGCIAKPVAVKTDMKATIPESAPGGAFPVNPDKVIIKQPATTSGSSQKPIQFDLDSNVDIPPETESQTTTENNNK